MWSEDVSQYSVAFAVGSCLLLALYPRVRERQAFPIAYCVFFAGVLIFCFRRSSSILCRIEIRW